MRKFLSAALILALAVATALVACATAQPPTVPAVPDASSYAWYNPQTGVYTWLSPDGGYTWAMPKSPPAPTAVPAYSPHMLGAAVPSGWAWVNAFTDTTFGSAGTGSGRIYNIHCVLSTQAATDAAPPLYVMCFNSAVATQPSNGTAPLAGCVSGALTTAGTDVTYSDQGSTHGSSITFSSGLLVAVSSTADTFTAPTSGNQARCDALIGN